MGNSDDRPANGDAESLDSVPSEILDPHCTESNPYTVTFQDVTSASFYIRNSIERTPCSVGTNLFHSVLSAIFIMLLCFSVFL